MRCLRCRRVIEPGETMIAVVVERPETWYTGQGARLEAGVGRWHWRCAPAPVRQYATVFHPGD